MAKNNFYNLKRNKEKILNEKDNYFSTKEELIEIIRDKVAEKIKEVYHKPEEAIVTIEKNKEYLKKKKEEYKTYIKEVIFEEDIKIKENLTDFINELVEEFVGYSVLSDAFYDPDVTDIYVLSWDLIFVEKKGINMKYHKIFKSEKHYKDTLDRFLREAGKEINNGDSKIVDFELYGDRGNAIAKSVTNKDYSLTFRKHSVDKITRNDLIKGNLLTEEMADFLGCIIQGECNLIYAGITGVGKTTAIRAILDHYATQFNKRTIVAEDTQELFLQNEHTLELVTVKSDDPKLAIDLDTLVYTSLRLKPRYIVVGEVRGLEARSAVEAMETGHSTIFTMHGNNTWNIINRLVTKYLVAMPSLGIDVVERIIGSALDYVVIQDIVPSIGRKIISISEISYDFNTKRVNIKDIYKLDLKEQKFKLVNKISEEKLEKMLRRGVKLESLKRWI